MDNIQKIKKEIASITHSVDNTIRSSGADTIALIGTIKTVNKIIDNNGLILDEVQKNSPINPYIKNLKKQITRDTKRRYKKKDHELKILVCKIAKGRGLSSYMIVILNSPLTLDEAIKHKKAKGTYCQIIFTGLHQPTKNISSDTIKILSKFLKRKTFKIESIDIANDFINDNNGCDIDDKMASSDELLKNPLYYKGSIYFNGDNVNIEHLEKLVYYDKGFKQKVYHKQKIAISLKKWWRVEATFKPKDKENKRLNFHQLIANSFFNIAIYDFYKLPYAKKSDDFNSDYLSYQINSILDNRVINNINSKKKFNSKDSLKSFNNSDFRKFVLWG